MGLSHEIMCQLRPLVFILGLNNSPLIGFTLVKSRIKKYGAANRGPLCKIAGARFHFFVKLRAKIVYCGPWHTAVRTPRSMATRGVHTADWTATKKTDVPRIAKVCLYNIS
jgi:hypothetical protein